MASRPGGGRLARRSGCQPLAHLVARLPAGLQPPGAAGLRPGGDRAAAAAASSPGVSPSAMTSKPVGAPCSLSQPRARRRVLRRRLLIDRAVLGDHAVAAQHAAHGFRRGPHAHHPDRDALLNGLAALPRSSGRSGSRNAGRGNCGRPPRASRIRSMPSSSSSARSRRPVTSPVSGSSVPSRAHADAEDRTAAGQLVERRDLAGYLPRPAPRQRRQHRAEADARGPRRHGGQHAPGVRTVSRLPDEDAVPARLLGQQGKLQLPGGRPAGITHRSRYRI